MPVLFTYTPSDDGTDENLLILLHGLGDTHVQFGKLGKSLKLPQTATLAICAPLQLPYFDTPAFQWYPSFTLLGEPITHPNPSSAVTLLSTVFTYLTSEACGWEAEKVHLFGFGQGGTVCVEFGLVHWQQQLAKWRGGNGTGAGLGSITTIAGPLISFPTLSKLSHTPLLVFHRAPSQAVSPGNDIGGEGNEMTLPASAFTAFRKGYANIQETRGGAKGGMPASTGEWEPIMRFWSERLGRRREEGLYEVLSGRTPI
ncbi:hypothetical protein BDV98DRAFT_525340 [Pterulicium gracile]|uniref:Phospholipase/carboxylesterase/thioesterase domain-containing protein n=1 Tax=Pterulicium gracile TaxID=1884261 RepID=A0A5C3QP52_9AGAR|nr:hypothetical protein BDV98DRAFT_525340 [Pterula gracilis]